MKKILSILALVAITASFSYGQWNYVKAFPDTNALKGGTGCHGITVDPDGNVWIQQYAVTDSLTGPGVPTVKVRALYIYKPDGTPLSFSPLKILKGNGIEDTLWNSQVGLNVDHQGNILVATYHNVYRVNYKTGAAMTKMVNINGLGLCAPACDAEGNIYTTTVLPGNPAKEYASDFSFISNALDTVVEYGRTMAVTPDGLTLYIPRYSLNKTLKLTRGDKFSSFTVSDTVFKGMACESMAWHPKTGNLWVAAGSWTNPPADPKYTRGTWYEFDPKTYTQKDSIKWKFNKADNPNERPRAMAFSTDGNTVWIGAFGESGWPNVQMHTKGGVGVKKESTVVNSFELSQNYPNPFNPSTEIKFSVVKAGQVSLKVYNMVGQEVATLVNQNLSAGSYSTNFDASKLASGTYIYELKSNGASVAKKMMLMK